jgi:lipopolysaccharide export system permease protein
LRLPGRDFTLRLMRLLDRYLLRELLIWLAFFFAGFLLLWTAFDLSWQLHNLQEAHLRAREVVEFCIYSIPEFMPIALPVSLLLALLWVLTNHARHNEITAMRAAGISLVRLCAPYFVVGFLATVTLFLFNERYSAAAANAADALLKRHVEQQVSAAARNEVKKPIFVNTSPGGQNRRWTQVGYNTRTGEIMQPDVVWTPRPGGPSFEISAYTATWTNHTWRFYGNVIENRIDQDPDKPPARILATTNALLMPQFTETPEQIQSEINVMGYYSHINAKTHTADVPLSDILNYLRWHPHPDRKMRNWIYTKLHGRFAGPFACLVVVFVAIPFAAGSGRRNVFVGVATSIFIFFAYFVLQQIGFSFAETGWIPSWFGAWFPNLFFVFASLVMMSKVR